MMRISRFMMMAILFAVGLLMPGCNPAPTGLFIAGSTSVLPLVEVLAEEYVRSGGDRVSIQGVGSTAGVQAVLQGIVPVGAISRELTADESAQGLVAHRIAYDLLVVVVHPSNPIGGLTLEQLRQIYSGAVTDWRAVGGRPGRIHLFSREAGSGARESFRSLVGPISRKALVQGSSGVISAAVSQDPQAIGYVSLRAAREGGLKLLAVDGQRPDEQGYRLVLPLSLVTRGEPDGQAAAFIRFIRSDLGGQLIREEGVVPVRD